MEASRVIISRETRAKLANPVLDMKAKKRLKVQRVKEYLKEHGQATTLDLAAVAGYDVQVVSSSSYNAGCMFVKTLEKKVIKNISTNNRKLYVLRNVPSKTGEATLTRVVKEATRRYTADEIEALAIEYAWHNDSNDLREFIKHVKSL